MSHVEMDQMNNGIILEIVIVITGLVIQISVVLGLINESDFHLRRWCEMSTYAYVQHQSN